MENTTIKVEDDNISSEGRDSSVDIIKGLAIVLVVYGHTWPLCRSYIYLFHMAVFLMASGFCYKTQINTWSEWKKYIF